MDKNAIKKYATWARRELISRVSQKAEFYGVTAKGYGDVNADSIDGRVLSPTEKTQRQALINKVRSEGYEQAMEEVAYTWFNRFSALRYMEVNNYLPTRVRVFTNENGEFKPQIIDEAIHLELDGLDMEKVYSLKDANDTEALYRYLLITQCNALSKIMPVMFQKIDDYTELLLPDYLLREGSVIEQMVTSIPEEDWTDQVQIIGWLYQYYNAEKKDEVFAALKKNVKITKENIPAATQLFTPDWIVRYMVENSLGRLWVEGHPNDELKSGWKYYLDDTEQEADVEEQLAEIRAEYAALKPEDILCIDPCAGSGHILVYMFDVLMQIYTDYGYTASEAVRSIIENNLYGLDIDDRAAQLANFAVIMKARSYDRRFLTRKDDEGKPDVPQPHVYAIAESNKLDSNAVDYFVNGDAKLERELDILTSTLYNAKEYGSILNMPPIDFAALNERIDEIRDDISIHKDEALKEILPLIQTAETLSRKYHVVCTNPPYVRNRGMDSVLIKYVKSNYEPYKFDLYAVFIAKCQKFALPSGYIAMITQHSFMFLSRFEQIRRDFYSNRIINMVHLGTKAFEEIGGEVVQTTSFILNTKKVKKYIATYIKLTDIGISTEKEIQFHNLSNRFYSNQERFEAIPGKVLAYWVSNQVVKVFDNSELIEDLAYARKGNSTSNNDRFLRFWHEVEFANINIGAQYINKQATMVQRWFPYNKGGSFRKWYGNNEYIVDWKNDAEEMRKIPSAVIANYQFFTKPGITWSTISGGDIGVRRFGYGFIFDNKGECLFCKNNNEINFFAAYLNSKVAMKFLSFLSPTLDFNCGYISKLPVRIPEIAQKNIISKLVDDNVANSKQDWDAFETSWDFKCHSLVKHYATVELTPLKSVFEKFILKNSVEDFLNEPNQENADNYICDYFKSRAKGKLLNAAIIDMDKGNVESRSIHMVSAFLLGWYIQGEMQELFPNVIGNGKWEFEYLWFLCCLYHDSFSATENIGISSDTSIMEVLYSIAKSKRPYTIYDDELLGVKLPKPTYQRKDVEAYFLYRSHNSCIDHGIKGGYVAFQKLVENYLEMRSINGNKNCFQTQLDGKFSGHTLLWDKKQIEAFAYAADAIIAHNIWHVSNAESVKIYTECGLSAFIVGSDKECLLSVHKSPLAYILSLIDTIEPVKLFAKRDNAEFVERVFNNITIGVEDNCIVIGQSDKKLYDFSDRFDEKMKNMSDWLSGIKTCYDKNSDRIYISLSQSIRIKDKFSAWQSECDERFNKLKSNEEELNRIFIDIYGLQDELTPEVEDKDVTVRKADLQREIKSLISYAVGCMLGRYSLDVDGLAYAGGAWDSGKYKTFIPDEDNIIPICDDEYFTDDIVGRFVDFIRVVYGDDTLEENLKFIADALGGKGAPRQVIRDYFINDFYADHLKVYQKRPIYWLFDSGRKNGFKCLIYIHRYKPDTIARIRTDYVHEQQARYRTAIAGLENQIANAGTGERVKLNKQLKKLQDQADELHGYEEKIHHLADRFISIDLDDGVKHNYEIFKDVLAKIK